MSILYKMNFLSEMTVAFFVAVFAWVILLGPAPVHKEIFKIVPLSETRPVSGDKILVYSRGYKFLYCDTTSAVYNIKSSDGLTREYPGQKNVADAGTHNIIIPVNINKDTPPGRSSIKVTLIIDCGFRHYTVHSNWFDFIIR